MVVFPGCKINIGLNITGKRAGGFHEIESIFYPLNLSDILEIVESDQFSVESSGLPIPGDPSNNLVKKAYDLLKEAYGLPPVTIHLHKVVPMGAGLGGGSADGAATLAILNQIFNLKIPVKELEMLADQLGSDCAFFIQNKPAYIRGKGEIVSPFDLNLDQYYIQLVNPRIHISTKEAFQGIEISEKYDNLKATVQKSPDKWQNLGVSNAFETNILESYKVISEIKSRLLDTGALYAAMTGTGSTVYGIFEQKPKPQFGNYFEWISKL